jgi:hypothetical protein
MIDAVGFDITSILDFKHAKRVNRTDPFRYSCPVCGVEYVDDDNWAGTSIRSQFRDEGWTLDHRELFAHATALAQVVRKSRGIRQPWPASMWRLLAHASYFVQPGV